MTAARKWKVLKAINRIRTKELGLEPIFEIPAGTHSAFSCPLSQALSRDPECRVGVTHRSYALDEGGERHDLPKTLHEFVRDFDAHAFPELEKESTPMYGRPDDA